MNNELEHKKLFTRRAVILGAYKIGLATGLLGRMFYLQILKNKGFSELSERNRIKTKIIPPLRGRIFDRSGQTLATNEKSYQLIFTKSYQHTKYDLEQIALKISELLNFLPEQSKELKINLNELAVDNYIIIHENLNWEQLVELELHLYDLNGNSIEIGFDRFYPHGSLCGHLTGYIGSISSIEAAKTSSIIYPNFKIGKNGIEKTQETLLHGQAGVNQVEVNAKGEVVRQISSKESTSGKNIELTIDIDLQRKASGLLENSEGVVLLCKVKTGEILVSVSKPSFDPNLFNHGISVSNWNNLINNPDLPLIDRSVALTYPPGSGFKINVAIAALTQKFNPETTFFCPGHLTVGNRVFHCWNKLGHGTVNLYQALASSCNVYFWNVAKIIGIQPIADTARKIGYGSKLLNNSLPREQSGIIPDPEWKKKNIGTNWTLADTINTAIGQGYVEATPMQILTMVARIATGREIIPSIIKDNANPTNNFAMLGLEQELKIVRKGMEMAANSSIGTAYTNRIIIENYAMAGKTGTCQVISKRHKDDDLSHTNIQKNIRNHGVFVSYAPLHDPEYAFCGIIEHGGTPVKAVRIAKELLTEAQIKKI
jgi:penicillin-binding protein 2